MNREHLHKLLNAVQQHRSEQQKQLQQHQALIEQLRQRLQLPHWLELDNDSEIAAGTRVRYFGLYYTCTTAHRKSLLQLPPHSPYWQIELLGAEQEAADGKS